MAPPGWDRVWLFNLSPSPLPSDVLFHEDQWVLVSACLPRAEEKLEMRDSIWWDLPFRSSHIVHELVKCCFNPPVLSCSRLGKDAAFLSLNFFCTLLSHPLPVSLLSMSMQPEGIRREKTQNSLICTEGKCLYTAVLRRTERKVGVCTLSCSACWCFPFPFCQSCPYDS